MDNTISPFDGLTLSEALHNRGINIRYLGVVADNLSSVKQLRYLYVSRSLSLNKIQDS